MRKSTAAWCEVGGKRFYGRSIWERNYARVLQFLKEKGGIDDWEHEPKTFWFHEILRGVRSYKPDFLIHTGLPIEDHYWVEVKGWMDPKSATKIKRFKKYYPSETIRVVDSKWFAANNQKMRAIIPGWEVGSTESSIQKYKFNVKNKVYV